MRAQTHLRIPGTPATVLDAPRPAFIGPRNAEAVTGQSWRWCRDHARAWGVVVLRVDAKPLVRLDEFVVALEAHAEPERETALADDATELEAMRAALGKRRRTTSPSTSRESAAESGKRGGSLPHRLPREVA
jgi:hypothetical protein